MTTIIYFVSLQFVNVIISTFKSVLTIKGTKEIAALINAIAYSVNIAIVYLVAKDMSLLLIVGSTLITNLIGVYTGLSILEKLRKERLWRISTTVATEKVSDFKAELLSKKIKFISFETTWDDFKVIDIFSRSKEESKVIRDVIHRYGAKYTISSNSNNLGG